MGLAACQARLLTLTMRRTDDQYKLMKLANDQLRVAAESEDIDAKFDLAKNAAMFSFKYDKDTTLSSFTYSDLMGSSAKTAGREPIYLTNKDGKVVLDSAYGAAMSAANMANGGRAADNARSFNAFCAQMTGDNSFSWYAALKTGKNIPTADIAAKAQSAVKPIYSSTSNDYSRAANDFTCAYGNPEFDYNYNSSGESTSLYEMLTSGCHEFGINSFGFTDQVMNWCQGGNAINYDDGTCHDGTYWRNLSAEEKQQVNEFIRLVNDAKENNTQVGYNSDYYTEEGYCRQLAKFASDRNLDYNVLKDTVFFGGNSAASESSLIGYSFNNAKYSTYELAYSSAFNYYSENTNLLGNTYNNVSSDIKSTAEYYYKIFSNCISSNNESKYVVDDKITDRAHMNAQLENNVYKINGKFAKEDPSAVKMYTARDDAFEYEKIKDDYNRDLNEVKKKEKQIEQKKTQVQADLSACDTEIQSVQSLIDSNVQRSFTYCQNG